jgi:hypothetical protein
VFFCYEVDERNFLRCLNVTGLRADTTCKSSYASFVNSARKGARSVVPRPLVRPVALRGMVGGHKRAIPGPVIAGCPWHGPVPCRAGQPGWKSIGTINTNKAIYGGGTKHGI